MEEKTYVIPLRNAYKAPRTKRAKRAVNIVRNFLAKHLKTDEVILSENLNQRLWENGLQKPPRKVKVNVIEEDSGLVAYPAE